MKYTQIVSEHRVALETNGTLKVANDIAYLLDHPLFGYPQQKERYATHATVRIRQPMYHTLCACLYRAKLPLPALEPEFYESCFPERVEKADQEEAVRIQAHVISQAVSPDSISAAVIQIMGVFPSCLGWSSLDKETLVALMNAELVKKGLQPLRPDYDKWEMGKAATQTSPEQPTWILVVDDSQEDLGKTLLALAGWKNIGCIPFHYERKDRKKPEGAEKAELLGKTAETILDLKPHIILMDEGLIDFEGSELIPRIRALAEKTSRKVPKFVANTGGDDEKQRAVGSFPNCDKGKKLNGIVRAIESLQS